MADLRQTRTFSIGKVRNLLSSARLCLQDAAVVQISDRRRFDAAYDCALSCALALLEANKLELRGLGHHQEALVYLVSTLRLKGDLAGAVVPMVRVRNESRYDGSSQVNSSMVQTATQWSDRILAETEQWFSVNQPLALKD